MISGIDLNAVVRYTCKEDKTEPTVWLLGALPSTQMAKIAKESVSGDFIKQMIELVRRGVKGWENFGTLYETTDDGLPLSIIDIIPMNILVELGTEILTLNQLSAAESKN